VKFNLPLQAGVTARGNSNRELKEVYIDGEFETIDTTNWLPKVIRKDYIVGLTGHGSGVDPDLSLYLIYGTLTHPHRLSPVHARRGNPARSLP